MDLTPKQKQLILSILEVYLPVAAPLISEEELDETQALKDQLQDDLDHHTQEELHGLDN